MIRFSDINAEAFTKIAVTFVLRTSRKKIPALKLVGGSPKCYSKIN